MSCIGLDFTRPGKLPKGVRWIGGKVARKSSGSTVKENSEDSHIIDYFELSDWDTIVADGAGTPEEKVLPKHFLETVIQYDYMKSTQGNIDGAKAQLDLIYDYIPTSYEVESDYILQIPGLKTGIMPVVLESDWFDRNNDNLDRDASYDLLAVPLLAVSLPRPVRSLETLKAVSYAYGPSMTYCYFGTNINVKAPQVSKAVKLGQSTFNNSKSLEGLSSFHPNYGTEEYKYFDVKGTFTATDIFTTLVVFPWSQAAYEGQLISKIELQGVFGEEIDSTLGVQDVLNSFETLITKVEEGNVTLGEILKK